MEFKNVLNRKRVRELTRGKSQAAKVIKNEKTLEQNGSVVTMSDIK